MLAVSKMQYDLCGRLYEFRMFRSRSKGMCKDIGGSGMFTQFRVQRSELAGMYDIV